MDWKNKTPFLPLFLFIPLSLITLSCIIDTGPWFGDDFSALPSVSSNTTLEPNSHWFYIDLDESYYKNVKIPLYEINTTDEFGDTLSNRQSISTPEGISPSNCEIEYDPDIDFSEQFSKDTYCIMDVMEEEFDINNLALIYNIPDGMCHHVVTHFPWHFNQEAGSGPLVVYKCEVQTLTGTDEEGNNECSTEERYFLDASDCPTDDTCPTPKAQRSKGREDIQEFCAKYDKSDQEGKGNCCFGEYVVVNPNDDDSEVENGEWGGDLKTCIGGPARTSWELFDKKTGVPLPLEEMANSQGYRAKFIIESISSAFGAIIGTSVGFANYIKSLDVEASRVPSKVNQLLTGSNPLLGIDSDTGFAPYYFFSVECLDPASEVLHALHLMVQEWNTYEEFYDHWVSKGATQENDPDVEGKEGRDCDYEEGRLRTVYAEENCNDKLDLDDYSDLDSPPELPYE